MLPTHTLKFLKVFQLLRFYVKSIFFNTFEEEVALCGKVRNFLQFDFFRQINLGLSSDIYITVQCPVEMSSKTRSLFLPENQHFSVKSTFLLKSWFHGNFFFVITFYSSFPVHCDLVRKSISRKFFDKRTTQIFSIFWAEFTTCT